MPTRRLSQALAFLSLIPLPCRQLRSSNPAEGAGTTTPTRDRRSRNWALAMLPLMWACASTGGGTVTSPAAPVRCDEPTLVVLPEYPARQQRGDITIVAAAELPRCQLATRVTFAPRSPSFAERVVIGGEAGVPLTRTEQPQYALATPDQFAMIFSVTNGSERVFRAEGSVWAVTIDGAVVPSDYEAGLAALIVLPGQTREFRIPAISLNREWQGGVYAFQLYDVPVARDEAGSITNRDNFEWYYTLEYRTLESAPMTTKTCNVLLDDRPRDYVVSEGGRDPLTVVCP